MKGVVKWVLRGLGPNALRGVIIFAMKRIAQKHPQKALVVLEEIRRIIDSANSVSAVKEWNE